MSEILKACPFCGKIPKPSWIDESYMECTNRKCDIYSYGMSTGAWNTRPIEDALTARIAELKELAEGHDPFEDFPPKERGCDCSVIVLGKFEYEEEFTPFTNWDLCVYWFDEEKWHPLNGYVEGDDIVRWYALPHEEREDGRNEQRKSFPPVMGSGDGLGW